MPLRPPMQTSARCRTYMCFRAIFTLRLSRNLETVDRSTLSTRLGSSTICPTLRAVSSRCSVSYARAARYSRGCMGARTTQSCTASSIHSARTSPPGFALRCCRSSRGRCQWCFMAWSTESISHFGRPGCSRCCLRANTCTACRNSTSSGTTASSTTTWSRRSPSIYGAMSSKPGSSTATFATCGSAGGIRTRGEVLAAKGSSSQLELLEPGSLQSKLPEEPGVVDQVPAPQPAGVGRQPVEPLEAGALHPYRRLLDGTAVEVEGGANRYEHRCVEALAHARHPAVLFGRAHADPHNVGLSHVDDARHLVSAEPIERGIGRLVDACDFQSRKARLHPIGKPLRHPMPASIEEMTVSRSYARSELGQHQVRAVNPAHLGVAARVRHPNQRHPVGGHQTGGVEDVSHLGRAPAFHDRVHRTHADVTAIAVANPLVDLRERHMHVDRADADPKDVHTLDHRRALMRTRS